MSLMKERYINQNLLKLQSKYLTNNKNNKMNKIKGVKAFNKGLICRDFQFSENAEFEINEEIRPCKKGFHFCKEEEALSVLNYYSPYSEFARVESTGETIEHGDKIVTNKIKIKSKNKIRRVI